MIGFIKRIRLKRKFRAIDKWKTCDGAELIGYAKERQKNWMLAHCLIDGDINEVIQESIKARAIVPSKYLLTGEELELYLKSKM